MSSFLSDGWVDSFRHLYPDTVKYSWWSARTNARPRNIGWRIDYHTVNDEAKNLIKEAEIWDHVWDRIIVPSPSRSISDYGLRVSSSFRSIRKSILRSA